MTKENYDRLVELREEMEERLEEVKMLLRQSGHKNIFERAKAYWIGSIDIGLGDGAYVDAHSHTFKKTLQELRSEIEIEGEQPCAQCGNMFVIDEDSQVGHHLLDDGSIDHEQDATHAPYEEDDEEETEE